MSETKPVLIVGAGPTGMTAAMELARFGIPVRIIDKVVEPPTTSRAVGVQARTLELFEQRGMVEPMLAKGNRAGAASVYGGGKRVFRLDFGFIDSDYPYLLFISQCETETVLRNRLSELGVSIERGVELVAVGQAEAAGHLGQSDGVSATLRHQDGTLEEVSASYLISAEGAHSLTRTTLELDFKGKSLAENYALGDLHIDGDLPPTDFYIFSSGYGFMGLFPMGGSRFRLIASNPLSEPAKATKPDLDELQRIYDMRSPIAAKFHDLSWSSWFRINSRMVDTLRRGRIFLGGDAAHIHSPAGAQGMNTGIQDMIDLCWKLAMVYRGEATDALLNTYADDRIPAIRNVLTKTEGLTGAIGIENPIFRSIFNVVAPIFVGTDFVQRESTTRMSQIGLDYRSSPLSETSRHDGALRAGDRVPNLHLVAVNREGSADPDPHPARLFDLLDPTRFTLLYANIADPARMHPEVNEKLAPWKKLIPGRQIAPPDDDGQQAFVAALGDKPSIVLVRPDGYIGFIGGEHDVAELQNYCRTWFGEGAAA